MNPDSAIDEQAFSTLLQEAGETGEHFSVVPHNAGGNNRVFIIATGKRRLIAKWYFTHPSDGRDRLRSEFRFLEYAQKIGMACVPKPLSCLSDKRLALYEFVDGRPFRRQDVSTDHVGQATSFFLSLNGPERSRMQDVLPVASEACFSIADQFAVIRQRIERLLTIPPESAVDEAAIRFVQRLEKVFDSTITAVAKSAESLNIDVDEFLADEHRCISPSDFGFHNALLAPEGRVFFIDFEYAGWDDPAKMACDFFIHPAVPVEEKHFEGFLRRTMGFSTAAGLLMSRARIMLPLFRIKWSCIVLNEFLPESAQRRRFADPKVNPDDRKWTQLDKANRIIESLSP